jgi:flavodoxin
MKALVIYDSNYGNTQKVAEAVAAGLGAKAVTVSEARTEKLDDLDLLVVGSPIIGWRPTEKMMNFLGELKDGSLSGLSATTFDTRVKLFIHGDAKDNMANSLEKIGAKIIAEPRAFYVRGKEGPLFEGEIEKATAWTEIIKRGL